MNPKRIDISEPQEINYWTKSLGVSQDQLIEAVQKFGPSASAIKQVLAREINTPLAQQHAPNKLDMFNALFRQ